MQLKEQYASDRLKLISNDSERVCEILESLQIKFVQTTDCILINLNTTMDSLSIIEKCKPYLSGFEVYGGTMDDAFIEITGREIRE